MSILDEAKEKFLKIVTDNNFLRSNVDVKMRPLSAEEAIGKPKRDDYPLLLGKEVLVEARFNEAKGQVFTDEPSDFSGTVRDVLSLKLDTNRNRAILVATINAVLRYLNMTEKTVHCRNEEPELCSKEMADRLFNRYGEDLTIGLIGLQPSIAADIIKRFSPKNIQIADLDKKNIGRSFDGVIIKDGRKYQDEVVAGNFLALSTGSTIVNGTIDRILEVSKQSNKNRVVIFFGTTIAGVADLMNLKRLCFQAH